jgi:hypothetical protein
MKTKEILQIKISLMHAKPAIWRRIQVPGRLTLKKLHEVIQVVMGWQNSHLHQFTVGDTRYSDPNFEMDEYAEEGDELVRDTSKIKISEIAKISDSFIYEYDFGDGWHHQIEIEKAFAEDQRTNYPICIGGESACPPEDCGGMGGYANLLEQLKNPRDPDHDSVLTWLGGFFDPKSFDPNHINRDHLWMKRW